MKIVTYNVNGLRSALSKGLTDWIAAERPDILCLQETKAQPEQIPTLELEALGYRCYFFSAVKKGYSGVAILTRRNPTAWRRAWVSKNTMRKGVSCAPTTASCRSSASITRPELQATNARRSKCSGSKIFSDTYRNS